MKKKERVIFFLSDIVLSPAGVGLAMVCAVKGYPFVCVMSENYSVERRKLMRFLGAKVILTKKEHKATGMLIKAQELADAHGYFYAKQFENEANAWMHEQTTGPELIRAFEKREKTWIISSWLTDRGVQSLASPGR